LRLRVKLKSYSMQARKFGRPFSPARMLWVNLVFHFWDLLWKIC